jgi:hypothetical protein
MENFIIYFEKVISAKDIEDAEKKANIISNNLHLEDFEMTVRGTSL